MQRSERRLQRKEEQVDRRLDNFEKRERQLNEKESEIDAVRAQVDELHAEHLRELERVSQLTMDEGRELLLSQLESEIEIEASLPCERNGGGRPGRIHGALLQDYGAVHAALRQ